MKSNDKPYVICHMLSSLDGKITGDYFSMREIGPVLNSFKKIREDYQCSAILNGAVTAASIFANGYIRSLRRAGKSFTRKDYIADRENSNYAVAVDIEGRLRWNKNYIKRPGQPKSHVIEILTENVSDDYLAYLQELQISYLFAGKKDLDIKKMLHKLRALFGIDRLMITGGGVLNWSFLQADCIDELSIVMAPLCDGMTETATLFDRSSYLAENIPKAFSLGNVKALPGDAVWLQYYPK